MDDSKNCQSPENEFIISHQAAIFSGKTHFGVGKMLTRNDKFVKYRMINELII